AAGAAGHDRVPAGHDRGVRPGVLGLPLPDQLGRAAEVSGVRRAGDEGRQPELGAGGAAGVRVRQRGRTRRSVDRLVEDAAEAVGWGREDEEADRRPAGTGRRSFYPEPVFTRTCAWPATAGWPGAVRRAR